MKKLPISRKEIQDTYKRLGMKRVAEARAVLRQLRESGIQPKGYELTSPYGSRMKSRKTS